MVFSFFKKQSQKMPERPVARPRTTAPDVLVKEIPSRESAVPLDDLEFSTGNLSPSSSAQSRPLVVEANSDKAQAVVQDDGFEMAEFDRDFSNSSVMAINVDHDVDPLQADLEQAVILFANGQDTAARSLLEALIRAYSGNEGRRFWHLLFDLLQEVGDRAAFEKLGVEFAEAFETSPPTWRQPSPTVVRNADGPKFISLQGVLTADCVAPLAELEKLITQRQPAVIDCGKLIGCDDDVAGRLAKLLERARISGPDILLDQPEAFLRRLNDRLVAGEAKHLGSWLLLLELLLRHGSQAVFEERAVDYAVTFELSPPSWSVCKPTASVVEAARPLARPDAAHYFSGELKSCRFEDLIPIIEQHESPVLDFSGVRRMDFFSAGQLVNRLAPYKAAGRDIVIRNPNHLVAELMVVVGLNKQAQIILPKS